MTLVVDPAVVAKIKSDYILGKGRSIRETSESLGVKDANQIKALSVRATTEKWSTLRQRHLELLVQKPIEQAENQALVWQNKVFKASERDLEAINLSLSTRIDPVKGIDGAQLGEYVRARKLVDDMARRSLGLSDPVQGHTVEMSGQPMQQFILNVLQVVGDGLASGKISSKDIDVDALAKTEIDTD